MFSVIFPGQGSQIVGMGKEFFDKHELVKSLFKDADDILGFGLSKIILLQYYIFQKILFPCQQLGILVLEKLQKTS